MTNFSTIKKYTSSIVLVILLSLPLAGYAQNNSGTFQLLTTPTSDNSQSAPTPPQSAPQFAVPYSGSSQNTINTANSPSAVSGVPQNASYVAPTVQQYNNSLIPTSPAGGQQVTPVSGGAQGVTNGTSFALTNPLKGVNSVSDLILTFMKVISYLAVIFGVIMLMWVGLQFVLAQGKPEEIKKRSNELLWIVVGIGVILGARILITTVINTLQATGTVNPAIIQNAQNAINSQ